MTTGAQIQIYCLCSSIVHGTRGEMASAKDGEFSMPPTPNQKVTSNKQIEKTPVSSQSSSVGPTPNSRKKGFAHRYDGTRQTDKSVHVQPPALAVQERDRMM